MTFLSLCTRPPPLRGGGVCTQANFPFLSLRIPSTLLTIEERRLLSMFNVSFVGRDPILCPFYGFWLKPKAEHFSGEDSPWKASWEKCGEKLLTLSLPVFLTSCSSFLQMTSQTSCWKRLVSRSIIHKTVLLPLLLLLPFLSPAPTHSSRHFLLHDCTTIFGLKNNNLFKTMERRIKRK